MAPMLSRTERKLKNRVVETGETLARKRAAVAGELDDLLDDLTRKVTDLRKAIASAADDGVDAASHGLEVAIEKGRKGVHKLEKKWSTLDTRQKAGVIAGLVAALAAAAATPTIVRKVREARSH